MPTSSLRLHAPGRSLSRGGDARSRARDTGADTSAVARTTRDRHRALAGRLRRRPRLGYGRRCAPSADSPSAPSSRPTGRAGRARRQPALVLAPADPGPVRRGRPRAVARPTATTRSRCCRPVGPERLAQLAARRRVPGAARRGRAALTAYLTGARWYQRRLAAGDRLPAAIGYFSPEFGITAVLPQYSGGLGHPGRRPPQGRQRPRRADRRRRPALPQRLLPPVAVPRRLAAGDLPGPRPARAPISLLREADGSAAVVRLAMPAGPDLVAQIWKAQVGRVPLLLLDSDVEENAPAEREVTDRLYGGGSEHRLLQEMLLGIGGVRALRAFCRITGHPAPEVFHTNEGHAGFLGLERIRELTPTPTASPRPRRRARGGPGRHRLHHPHPGAGRHRPVPARAGRAVLRRRQRRAGVPVDAILGPRRRELRRWRPGGLQHGGHGPAPRPARQRRLPLHGVVSREMFHGLWPAFDAEAEVPITSITNGVHAPTWVAPRGARAGAPGTASTSRATAAPAAWDASSSTVADDEVWALAPAARAPRGRGPAPAARLVAAARRAPAELGWIDDVLDPDVLTIGFARRVPSYKRLTLMLRDPERLRRLLLHPERPVQIVVAGKAHPADDGGKRLIAGARPVRRRPGRCGTASCSCPTTTSRWPSRSTPAATCGSTTRCARSRRAAPRA